MTGIPILEVTIGLVFVYLLLSLVSSVVQEMIASVFSLRAKKLRKGLQNLLDDPNTDVLTSALYAHPLFQGITKKVWWSKKGGPSYVSARTFSMALMDIVKPANASGNAFAAAKDAVDRLKVPNEGLKTALKALIEDADGSVWRVRKNIEEWFDDAMERVGGWYKRQTQAILFVIGIVVAVGLNVDSIRVAESLWQDSTLRAVVAEEANQFIKQNPDTDAQLKELQQALGKLQLPIGWRDFRENVYPDTSETRDQVWNWVATAVGWTITALAISLGASFWFNALSKLLKLRATGTAPARKTRPAT